MSRNERSYLTPEEMKAEELQLLLQFAEICNELGLQYSLVGGTMLGAVRHHGFIPWDDDVDVCMSRPDYEALIKHSQPLFAERGLVLSPYANMTMEATPIVKVLNPTIRVHAEKEADDSFLWIDVLPVDGLPEDDEAVASIYSQAKKLRSAIMAGASTVQSGHTILRRVAKAIAGPLLRTRVVSNSLGRELIALATAFPYGSTPYVGVVTWGMYGPGERVSHSGFEKQVALKFEGHEFACMSCWDEYLSGVYGDYMTPPPPERQVAHGVRAWHVKTV